MDFFKMYDEVKDFESNYKKEHTNKEVFRTESTDRTEESEVTETEETEETEKERNLNSETENKIESEEN